MLAALQHLVMQRQARSWPCSVPLRSSSLTWLSLLVPCQVWPLSRPPPPPLSPSSPTSPGACTSQQLPSHLFMPIGASLSPMTSCCRLYFARRDPVLTLF